MDQHTLFVLAKLLETPLSVVCFEPTFTLIHSCSTSIEILPGGLQEWMPPASDDFPFVLEDGHLGVPQKVLYKLYMTAVSLYKEHLSISSVVLLANPAHQTALNTRKKLIACGSLDPGKELDFFALFIRGSKECAKQSIIWDHRRWILRHQYEAISLPMLAGWPASEDASSFPMIPLSVLEEECQLIRHACEVYPRNYHAWSHYHWILNVTVVAASRGPGPSGESTQDYHPFLRRAVTSLQEWIARHVSDYSAVHLLCTLAVLDCHRPTQLMEGIVDEIRRHALDLIVLYPAHEALWLYLRGTLALSTADDARRAVGSISGRVPAAAVDKYISRVIR
jgi:protein prenyltransferase alpha subunit repeat containing protein 1